MNPILYEYYYFIRSILKYWSNTGPHYNQHLLVAADVSFLVRYYLYPNDIIFEMMYLKLKFNDIWIVIFFINVLNICLKIMTVQPAARKINQNLIVATNVSLLVRYYLYCNNIKFEPMYLKLKFYPILIVLFFINVLNIFL